VLKVHYLLPDGIICLLHAFSNTSGVASIASPCEGFCKILFLALGILKLSLDECTELIILGLMTRGAWIVLPPLGKIWKSYNFCNNNNRIIITRPVVTIPTYGRKDRRKS
jgi:hypothetical protein